MDFNSINPHMVCHDYNPEAARNRKMHEAVANSSLPTKDQVSPITVRDAISWLEHELSGMSAAIELLSESIAPVVGESRPVVASDSVTVDPPYACELSGMIASSFREVSRQRGRLEDIISRIGL